MYVIVDRDSGKQLARCKVNPLERPDCVFAIRGLGQLVLYPGPNENVILAEPITRINARRAVERKARYESSRSVSDEAHADRMAESKRENELENGDWYDLIDPVTGTPSGNVMRLAAAD